MIDTQEEDAEYRRDRTKDPIQEEKCRTEYRDQTIRCTGNYIAEENRIIHKTVAAKLGNLLGARVPLQPSYSCASILVDGAVVAVGSDRSSNSSRIVVVKETQ